MTGVQRQQSDPPANRMARISLLRRNLRGLEPWLSWFRPADCVFVSRLDLGHGRDVFVYEYVPTGRLLYIDRRGIPHRMIGERAFQHDCAACAVEALRAPSYP